MTKIKTSRKEELRSNKLIDFLKRTGEALKKYVGFIALGLAVVVVAVVILWRFAADRARQEGIVAGNSYQYAQALRADWQPFRDEPGHVNVGTFKTASEEAAGTPMAARALLDYGNALLVAANTDPKIHRPTDEAARARRGRVQQAAAVFRQALSAEGRSETTDALAYLGLSGVARNLGDFAEARRHAETAKDLSGASPFAVRLAEQALGWIEENREPVTLPASRPARAEATVPILPDLPILDEPEGSVPPSPSPALPSSSPALPSPSTNP